MKKIILGLLAAVLFIGCVESPDEPLSLSTTEDSQFDALKKEYNINKQGLVIESATNGIDTTKVFFNGRIDGKLWIGCYDKTTKNNLLDWTGTTKLDTIIDIDKGYGEHTTFQIEEYHVKHPYKRDNSFCFLLWGQKKYDTNYVITDLYFIDNKGFIKKDKLIPDNFGFGFYEAISPWFEGVIVKHNDMTVSNYICYTMKGDSLFSLPKNTYPDNYTPISYEECISFNMFDNSNTVRIKRLNVKLDSTLWDSGIFEMGKLPINARIDNKNIVKQNDIWIYEISYTQFDGKKDSVKVSVNINSGKFEII
ncbi:hypothetical protein FACS189426_06130 [Bacteroidia bacterium]|nr:hypothetical protein FACS189426_06130 [Bacteroidia bacterium]GHV71247.1 hypothetical protein FACS189420_5650 [Bacteroidia bacterium]